MLLTFIFTILFPPEFYVTTQVSIDAFSPLRERSEISLFFAFSLGILHMGSCLCPTNTFPTKTYSPSIIFPGPMIPSESSLLNLG